MAFSLARVAQVAGAMGEADADPAVEPPVATDTDATPSIVAEPTRAAAIKQEAWRNYQVGSKVELVERLLGPGALAPNQGDWGLLTLWEGTRHHPQPTARQVLRHRLHAARPAHHGAAAFDAAAGSNAVASFSIVK